MIQITFEDAELFELYTTGQCRGKKYKKIAKNKKLVEKLIEAVNTIASLSHISELSYFGRFHYEKLKYEYQGKSSIRIQHKSVERLIFRETPEGIAITILELNQDHYGNLR